MPDIKIRSDIQDRPTAYHKTLTAFHEGTDFFFIEHAQRQTAIKADQNILLKTILDHPNDGSSGLTVIAWF